MGHTGRVLGLAWSRDSNLLASAAEDGTVRMWDVASATALRTLRASSAGASGRADEAICLDWSLDGSTLATGYYSGAIRLWDAQTGRRVRSLKEHTDRVVSLAFSHDGRLVASKSYDNTV